MPEHIIEVNKKNRIIGKNKITAFFATSRIHRSSNLLILDSKNRLLLQRRSRYKKLYPNKYSFSVSGAVSWRENNKQAIIREMKEELGIYIKCKPLFSYKFFDFYDKSFAALFLGNYDGKLKINKEEVESVKWVTMDFIKKDIRQRPHKYSPVFIYALKKYITKCRQV